MSRELLFVCTANVCRSPLMAFTFAEAVTSGPDNAGWMVSSRGVSVPRKQPMCDVSASLVGGGLTGEAFAKAHTSMQLTAEDLDGRDLIIVATREQRAFVAQLRPTARARTFTLFEAIGLGETIAQDDVQRWSRRRADNTEPSLAGYPELLNSRRGRVTFEPTRRPLLPWSRVVDPQDIPDDHHGKLPEHTATLKRVRTSILTLQRQMGDFLAVRP